MATLDEISRLRRMTDLTEDDGIYTNDLLSQMIDELGVDRAAGQVWREKAAKLAGLVDITESGSSRSLSRLYEQALRVGEAFEPPTNRGRSFTVEIERA